MVTAVKEKGGGVKKRWKGRSVKQTQTKVTLVNKNKGVGLSLKSPETCSRPVLLVTANFRPTRGKEEINEGEGCRILDQGLKALTT